MSVQALNTYDRSRELEEASWVVIESIDLNADMQELQEEAFETVITARRFRSSH